jgi:MOSC domain-containing protein YiiM
MSDAAEPDVDSEIDSFVRRWEAAVSAGPRSQRVAALVRRLGDGAHDTPAAVELDVAAGVVGDRWSTTASPPIDGQVSIMDTRVLHALVGSDRSQWHVPGDNLVIDLDLAEASLPVGTRLRIGGAVLEITGKVHAGCAKFRARLGAAALAWVNGPERKGLRLRGVYATVIATGACAVGDAVERL